MTLLHLFYSLAKVGLFGFGGGYAMIPIMEKELVSRTGWLSLEEFIDIVAVAEITPGPVAINAATFVGMKVAGVPGSAVATLGMVAPSMVLMGALSLLYMRYGNVRSVNAFFRGLRPTIVALLVFAALKLAETLQPTPATFLIGAGVFLAVAFKGFHPIGALILAAILGLLLY